MSLSCPKYGGDLDNVVFLFVPTVYFLAIVTVEGCVSPSIHCGQCSVGAQLVVEYKLCTLGSFVGITETLFFVLTL